MPPPTDRDGPLLLRGARVLTDRGWTGPADVGVRGGTVRDPARAGPGFRAVPLDGLFLLPALVNAHDVLDLSTLPPVGRPPHRSVYEWTRAAEAEIARLGPALAVPLVDRLFLGGMRNLLAGASAVLHHHPDHRSLWREEFPVRVQRRYGFAHSPGLTPALRRAYRTTDRRVPWVVRAAEGSDAALRGELDRLAEANVLRQNTVVVHGTALAAEDGPRLAAARASLVWCPESDLRLYGRTAPVAGLRAAGVAIGLGSDAPPAGARDPLSNLAAAAREGGLDEAALLALATRESATVARLPVGAAEEGSPADLLAVDAPGRLLDGDRGTVRLLLVRGRPLLGDAERMAAAGAPAIPVSVDGARLALAAPLARRLVSILRRHPAARGALWLGGVAL